ncbi:NPR1 [Cordylochernes scorpioides]|uniref:Guanylate cyclase n=1 Tax=Cordylochernes scorpioides TaxID=51811 RepID=A0ABY6KL78_9ARAC|nr:NPR1 [Cordylochernes scorpioides]
MRAGIAVCWAAALVACNPVFEADLLAVFLPSEELPYSYHVVRPTLDLALDAARRRYPHLAFRLAVRIGRSDCATDTSAAGQAAEAYYRNRVTAFVGPGCSRALDAVARMATFWNVAACTAGGVYLDKTALRTLTRVSPSLERAAGVTAGLLDRLGWRHVALLSARDGLLPRLVADALRDALRDHELHAWEIPPGATELRPFLSRARRVARVVVLAGSEDTVRGILLAAYDLGMGGGDFAFINLELLPAHDRPWHRLGDSRNEDARHMFESLLTVRVRVPTGPEYGQFATEVIRRAQARGANEDVSAVNVVVAGFYECVLLYAWALNATLATGGDPLDGRSLSELLWDQTFHGELTGDIFINQNGDREADYTVDDLDPATGQMTPVLTYYGARREFHPVANISFHWPGLGPPADVPRCGFLGDECPVRSAPEYADPLHIWMVTGASLLLLLILTGLGIYRRIQSESELQDPWWRVHWSEVVLPEGHKCDAAGSNLAVGTSKLGSDSFSSTLLATSLPGTKLGLYQGQRVCIRLVQLRSPRFAVTRHLLIELRQIRDLTHENLARVVGLCPDPPNVAVLTEYSPRGSLKDLLENPNIKLDWPFRFSLIGDIVEGMVAIHRSAVTFHGRLKSTNCVIDGRFVVKLTDFGLRSLSRDDLTVSGSSLLWTAPEHLRSAHPLEGSQKGDVYSFGIILQEIVTRSGPFDLGTRRNGVTQEEVVARVRVGSTPPYRPEVCWHEAECPSDLEEMATQCWDENPALRPSFTTLRHRVKAVIKTMGCSGLLDNLLDRLAQYADNLEQLVEERTAACLEEKRRSEALLYELLPRPVADQLRLGRHVRPQAFDCVTVCFSDIVDFTTLAAESTPMEVVTFLNDLYSCFDGIIGNYDVYKVETIGDAYMVVSGLPEPNGVQHAAEIARMALGMLGAVRDFRIQHRPGHRLLLRSGVHSGPCAAGVVGLKMPRYCLFGDTVNTASRLESTGEGTVAVLLILSVPNFETVVALRIHVSVRTKSILDQVGSFHLVLRGDIHLKAIRSSSRTCTGWSATKTSRKFPEENPPGASTNHRVAALVEVGSHPGGNADLLEYQEYELKMSVVPDKEYDDIRIEDHPQTSQDTLETA